MKKFFVFLFGIFVFFVAFADTINLHWLNEDGSTYQNSTCVIDSDLILPSTTPTKYGYTFTGWKITNYIPIEYLEYTGTQYIDPNIIFTGTTSEIDTKFLVYTNRVNSYSSISATQQTDNERWGSVQYDKIQNKITATIGNRSAGTALLFSSNGSCDHMVYSSTNTSLSVTFNGETKTLNSGGSAHTGNKLLIGCKNTAGTRSEMFVGRLYNYKLTVDSIIVRDFIPVLDYGNVPCMYDRVSKQFFYNQGTGQFIAGPVVSEQ